MNHKRIALFAFSTASCAFVYSSVDYERVLAECSPADTPAQMCKTLADWIDNRHLIYGSGPSVMRERFANRFGLGKSDFFWLGLLD